MRRNFYSHMAWLGIRNNRRLYTPYILTCIGMVTMFYIITFLSVNASIKALPGGGVIVSMLSMGSGIIGIFAVIFLFYTNSFLGRRRKKEFGLYNILGMGKGNLARVLVRENIIILLLSLSGGLFFGILFSKFAELAMVNIMGEKGDYFFRIDGKVMAKTAVLFAVIFAVLFLNMLRQVHFSNPAELLHSENAGERPPKANGFIALLGAAVLGGAYYIAVTIQNPVMALVWFFIAVIMVIIGTYMLFIAGSVTLCRLLQKNKRYYYKTGHFVSVSSMSFRMKRNGAGLASICILCTMVLVMLSATVCLYAGGEKILKQRYPGEVNLTVYWEDFRNITPENTELLKQTVRETLKEQGALENGESSHDLFDYTAASFGGYIHDGIVKWEQDDWNEFSFGSASGTFQIFVVSIEDYNRLMDDNIVLEENEAVVYVPDSTEVSLGDDNTLYLEKADYAVKIVRQVKKFVDNGESIMVVLPSILIFVNDLEEYLAPLKNAADSAGNRLCKLKWYYSFDVEGGDEVSMNVGAGLSERFRTIHMNGSYKDFMNNYTVETRAGERSGFYSLYGGLFFLAIILGLVFILAAVLVIYYKQIAEGYEDCGRFEIMQKVGMTKREIKKSINSQVLTVFFLPLLAACLHLAFAFPIVEKLLLCFGMSDRKLFLLVNLCCVLVFAAFYTVVYRVTGKAYYNIVKEK